MAQHDGNAEVPAGEGQDNKGTQAAEATPVNKETPNAEETKKELSKESIEELSKKLAEMTPEKRAEVAKAAGITDEQVEIIGKLIEEKKAGLAAKPTSEEVAKASDDEGGWPSWATWTIIGAVAVALGVAVAWVCLRDSDDDAVEV